MTAQTLSGAVTALANVVATVSGVTVSEDFDLFNVNERVFALNYVMNSVVELSETGTKQHVATIACDLLTPFVNMTTELQTMLTIADAATTACVSQGSSVGAGTMFSGAMDTFVNCRVEFLPFYPYNNIPHIGYRIMLEGVKLKLDL